MAAITVENKDSGSVAAAGFALYAAVLMAAFLYFRGNDIGRLPQLFENLGGGPLFGWAGFRDSVVGVIAAVLIGTSWYGLGSLIFRYLPLGSTPMGSATIRFVIRTSLGAAAWSLVLFFVGLAGGYSGTVAIVSLIVAVALAPFSWRETPLQNSRDEEEGSSAFDWLMLVIVALPMVLALLGSLAPPTAKDTLLYHFALPKAFVAQGSNAFVEGNIASFLALGTEMHAVWAMLLGGVISPRAAEAAAGATLFLFFPLVLLAVFGWARSAGISRRWSLVAAAITGSVPTAFHVASSGYIDLALTLYITLAVFSLCSWWTMLDRSYLILIAIFLGAALSIKLTALFVIAAFALIILLKAREQSDGMANVVAGGFGALLLAAIIASPWYLRTWKATGSPLFPFYMSVWKGEATGWDVERSNLFQAMNTQYGGTDADKLNYLTAPVRVSIMAQPELAELYDGVLGVAFLLGLPLLAFALWKFELSVDVKVTAGVAAILYFFWLFSSEQLRYVLPILPMLAVGIAASAEMLEAKRGWRRSVWQYSFAAATLFGVVTSVAWFCQRAPLRVDLGGESRDQFLDRNLDYYPYYENLNTETSPGSKVWLIDMRRDTYTLDRPAISDYLFEDWTLRKMVWESRTAQELRAKTAAMGVDYVLTRHDFLLDPAISTLVDDKRPRAENDAKIRLAREFILDPARTIKSDNKFSLIKVF